MVILITENDTLDESASIPLQGLTRFLQQLGKGGLKSPDRLAQIIQAAINCHSARKIRNLEQKMKAIDKALEIMLEKLPGYR